jgi:hypothetical protein
MEKSIEDIWREGFIKSDALVTPKINNLYTQKSIDIIDRFQRMFKTNLIVTIIFSFGFLFLSSYNGIPILGIIFFVVLTALVIINKRLLDRMEKIDKRVSIYEYLNGFNQWIQKMVTINKRLAVFLYPIFFMSTVISFWFNDAEGIPLGQRLVGEVLYGFPDIYMVQGVPLIAIIVIISIVALLAFFSGRIYQLDLNLVYGGIFKKLEELMADMEELQK